MRVSFPPYGKEFGAEDFCELRLRLISAAVNEVDKRAFKAEKINTGLRPAMSPFAYRPPNRTEDRGRLLVLFYHHCIARSLRSAGTYQRSPVGFE